jgi:hypothetical protein
MRSVYRRFVLDADAAMSTTSSGQTFTAMSRSYVTCDAHCNTWYAHDMSALAALTNDLPPAPPLLDRAAVEQARLVRLARDHLAAHEPSVDYGGLAQGRNSTVLAARQWVKRQRGRGRIFVIDHGGMTLLPTFQLDEVFDVNEQVAAVVTRLSGAGLTGWAQWQWFTALNPWIDARPIDVIGNPDVMKAVDGLVDA